MDGADGAARATDRRHRSTFSYVTSRRFADDYNCPPGWIKKNSHSLFIRCAKLLKCRKMQNSVPYRISYDLFLIKSQRILATSVNTGHKGRCWCSEWACDIVRRQAIRLTIAWHQTTVHEVDYPSDRIIRRNDISNLRDCGINDLRSSLLYIFR